MPMSPRLLRPRAAGILAIARDASGNVIAPVNYTADGIAYTAHIFNSNGSLQFLRDVDVEYLLVAGGGGGGSNFDNASGEGAGGGGGGGLITNSNAPIPVVAGTYNITVGAGGAGAAAGRLQGTSGNPSSAFGVTVIGGGGGGGAFVNTTGRNGGSGGGGGRGTAPNAGAATVGQGFAGGSGISGGGTIDRCGGGGGGARGSGFAAILGFGGNGGPGVDSSLTGFTLAYAGGGGGGRGSAAGAIGLGGAGGGGAAGSAGVANTGGGGGGGTVGAAAGSNGGSGVVVVRYKNAYAQPFLPSSIPGLALWLDAADASTLGPTTSGPGTVTSTVGYWGDRSGGGLHATVASGAAGNFPTLTASGRHHLSFDGNDWIRNGAATLKQTDASFFFVFGVNNTGFMNLFSTHKSTGDDWNRDGAGTAFINSTTASSIAIGNRVGFAGYEATTSIGLLNYNAAATNNASLYLLRDGKEFTQTNTSYADGASSDGYILGGRWLSAAPSTTGALQGRLHEVLWYNRNLTTTEQTQVRNYLRAKWFEPFNPTAVSGLSFWLDASDSSFLTTVSDGTGNGVSEWRSRVGGPLKAAQATAANRPYLVPNARNGRGVVQFDGNNDFLIQEVTSQTNQPLTFVWAGINNNTGSWCDGGATFARMFIYGFNGTKRLAMFAGGSEIAAPVGSTAGFDSWSVISVVFNGASSVARVNGSQVASGNPGTGGLNLGLNLGCGYNAAGGFMNGQWGTWLIYNKALSTTELQVVERGLGAYWGVEVA